MESSINLLTHPEARIAFSISEADVLVFSDLVDDHNPIHLDAEYASNTSFKRPVVHGILGSAIFSKFFGTIWPGEGTLYLKQSLDFKRPMYPNESYEAVFTLIDHKSEKHEALVRTQILKTADQKVCTSGEAVIKHPNLL